MDERTFEALELQDLIELAARHAQTAPGRIKILQLRPAISRSEILRELDTTGECVAYLNTRGRFGLSGIEDLSPVLAELQVEGTSLEPKQILALERLLFAGKELKEVIKSAQPPGSFPRLAGIASEIPDLRPLLSAIHGKILPSGEIDDNASPELRAVRKDLAERRNRIHRTLESIFRGQGQAVQEEIITFRNGRFVIPVRTDSRNQIPGVVHGLSSSGQTTFMEPMTVIGQNNDLVRLREQEAIEVSRILLAITESLRRSLAALQTTLGIVAYLDLVQAKAMFALEFHCVMPKISTGNDYVLQDARHILLERSLRESGAKPVPISIELDKTHRVLVISGPNAGGKTVALKTAGLISLMAQMGFLVPAREAVLPVFDQIFADIGDHQSISANLSTFTAHMRRIAETERMVKPPSFVLLDEVGTGTDPDEGSALAIAIVDFFLRRGAITIASTHYPALKMWASQTAGVRNASVEFDERSLQPTYRLILGIAGASSGLEIARRMQVTEGILDRAKSLLEPSHAQAREYLRQLKETLDEQERLRASLEEERTAVADKFSRLEAEFLHKEESRKKEFNAALESVLEDFRTESDRAVRKIRDQAEAARTRRQAEKQALELRRKSSKLQAENLRSEARAEIHQDLKGTASSAQEELREGDRVSVHSLNRDGTIESVKDGVYVVMVGPLRYRASRDDLTKTSGGNESPQQRVSHSLEENGDALGSEIKVIGLAADEALERVDKFIDQAFLAGAESIRIVHGHGKGILRKAIAEFLLHHPQVERFSLAPPEKGGSGATVADLKK
jgi:DNA mismatch repair protein MutS2